MAITRNRYGKHMQAILAVVAQAPGEWHTLSTDTLIRNAAARLERKGLIQLSSDGAEARFIVPPNANVSKPTQGPPDGWILSYAWREPQYSVTFSEARMQDESKAGNVQVRPFRFIGE